MRRVTLYRTLAILGLLLVLELCATCAAKTFAEGECDGWTDGFWVTGYSVSDFPDGITADGTSVYTDEPIAAASQEIPLGSFASIEGLGVYRIADRGAGPAWRWLDVLVQTRSEAYAITGYYQACITEPE